MRHPGWIIATVPYALFLGMLLVPLARPVATLASPWFQYASLLVCVTAFFWEPAVAYRLRSYRRDNLFAASTFWLSAIYTPLIVLLYVAFLVVPFQIEFMRSQ